MQSVQEILAQLKRGLSSLYGSRLAAVLLYGSRARGDASADSDIDVLVVLRGEYDPGEEIGRTSELVSGLSLQHDCLISCFYMSEDRYLTGGGPFLRNIRREAVAV